VKRALSPSELFPAGLSTITTRNHALSTGVTLRVLESGPADGLPVVMLHGWGASAYMYRHALDLLPGRGMRAIAVDLRGYGLSDKPAHAGAYTLDSYCADLDALLATLGLGKVALIGQSMGGGLSLRYALRNAERVSALVLVNPVGLVSIAYLPLLQVVPRSIIAAIGRRLVPRQAVDFILRYVAYGDPSLPTERDVDEYWAPTQLDGFVNAARSALSEFDWRPLNPVESASLSVPTTIILGTKDRLIRNAGAAARNLPRTAVHDIVGGHCVLEENPARVYQIAADFLSVHRSVD
jgi:4,5:9,10-diseco-3-hydroxy-5,9,17-trioxoandrosta-1(10),2-diene-4-oate hydrolase